MKKPRFLVYPSFLASSFGGCHALKQSVLNTAHFNITSTIFQPKMDSLVNHCLGECHILSLRTYWDTPLPARMNKFVHPKKGPFQKEMHHLNQPWIFRKYVSFRGINTVYEKKSIKRRIRRAALASRQANCKLFMFHVLQRGTGGVPAQTILLFRFILFVEKIQFEKGNVCFT